MKPLLVLVAIIIFSQQPMKLPDGKGAAKGKGTQVGKQAEAGKSNNPPAAQTPSVAPAISENKSAELAASTTNPNDDTGVQGKIVTFTGLLVVVGFLQFAAMGGQIYVYCRQAGIMAHQAREATHQRVTMGSQLKIMQGQLQTMQDAGEQNSRLIDAAKESADSAKKQIDLFISKERGRISIEIDDLQLPTQNQRGLLFHVRYHLYFRGASEVWIINSNVNALITSSDIPPREGGLGWPLHTKKTMTAGEPIKHSSVPIATEDGSTVTWTDVEQVKNRTKFVHFWASINYRDFCEIERTTSVRKIWRITDLPKLGGIDFSYWATIGNPEDNQET